MPCCGFKARMAATLLMMSGLCSCQRPPGSGSAMGDTDAAAAGAATAVQVDRLSVLRATDQPGFALADTPRRFEFPRDHGPHPSFRHEWWYLTGQLHAADGQVFGFELTFFRLALTPPGAPGAAGAPGNAAVSAWRAQQVYAAHFAITDIRDGRFFNATRYARDALGLAGAQAQPFAVHVDDWSVAQAPGAVPAGAADPNALHWQLRAADGDYRLQLDLSSDQPPVLNGVAGLSRKADAVGAASYYYSMPRLKATGTISRRDLTLTVSGLAWLDREWGSGSLGPQQQGWDWFALDLDDGSSLMFYALRDRDGRRDRHSAGTFVDPRGHVTALANDDVDIVVQRHWRSPRGGQYPAQWIVRVGSQDLRLQVTPLLADQELSTQPRYWEGAVRVTGKHRGAAVNAQGYVELVGYAQAQASPSRPNASAPPSH